MNYILQITNFIYQYQYDMSTQDALLNIVQRLMNLKPTQLT